MHRLFLPTADFGDFNQYDSQEFLQKFALFPIVSIWFYILKISIHTYNKIIISDSLCSCVWYYQLWLWCYRTGFRMREFWRRPHRKWRFFIRRSGECVFKALSWVFRMNKQLHKLDKILTILKLLRIYHLLVFMIHMECSQYRVCTFMQSFWLVTYFQFSY